MNHYLFNHAPGIEAKSRMRQIRTHKYQVSVRIIAGVVAHLAGAISGKYTNQFVFRVVVVLPGVFFCGYFLVQQPE